MVTISTQSVDVLADGLSAIIEKVREFAVKSLHDAEAMPEGEDKEYAGAVLLGYSLALSHFVQASSHLVNGLDAGIVAGVTVRSDVGDDGLPTGMYL
jgi:hypothetical protein